MVKKILFLLLLLWMAAVICGQSEPLPAVDEVIARNIRAAGGAEKLASVKNFSFQVGYMEHYTLSENRLKLRLSVEEPVVYEVLIAAGQRVRRNSLGRLSELSGVERGRWLALAPLYSGLFTLKNIPGPFVDQGLRAFGPERYRVLQAALGDLQASFYVDAADFLVKRMVLAGADDSGQAWELSCEFADFTTSDGIMIPKGIFLSQVGVSGTSSPRAREISKVVFNEQLPDDAFDSLDIRAGRSIATPGQVDGNVLFYFFDDDFFVQIFTNWTIEDVRAAGWQNGDRLVYSIGGATFESRIYFPEDKVDDPTVYAPGNSLTSYNPARYPAFYIQFNTLSPRERFDDLKSRVKTLSAIQARKKT